MRMTGCTCGSAGVRVYVDDLWFQGSAGATMVGAYMQPEDLPAHRRQPTTLDNYIQRLSEAAGS